MTDDSTIAAYNARAADYAAFTQGHDDPLLTAFIAALPRGACVLDLGCGPGFAAARMADAGHCVIAKDASPEMIALAARHPGVAARRASFDDIAETAAYDGIWANFSLLHAPRADLPRHLAALHRAARPGARLHIALKLGSGEGPDALGRFYTYYSEDDLVSLLETAGFTVASRSYGADKGLSGDISDWIAITAHA